MQLEVSVTLDCTRCHNEKWSKAHQLWRVTWALSRMAGWPLAIHLANLFHYQLLESIAFLCRLSAKLLLRAAKSGALEPGFLYRREMGDGSPPAGAGGRKWLGNSWRTRSSSVGAVSRSYAPRLGCLTHWQEHPKPTLSWLDWSQQTTEQTEKTREPVFRAAELWTSSVLLFSCWELRLLGIFPHW